MILQVKIPDAQRTRAQARLPAMQPVGGPDWLTVDEAYAPQLAEKARLIAQRRADVIVGAGDAVVEALDVVLDVLAMRSDFEVQGGVVRRPDGVRVAVDRIAPLVTLSRLIQEDICILEKRGGEHVLTAALLCFPASWTLAEKIGKPLTRIHDPVPEYAAQIAVRVQRMFDGVRAGLPMWRANLLGYDDPALYQPQTEGAPRSVGNVVSVYERSERQTVLRLPKTGAVVFAIHTAVVKR